MGLLYTCAEKRSYRGNPWTVSRMRSGKQAPSPIRATGEVGERRSIAIQRTMSRSIERIYESALVESDKRSPIIRAIYIRSLSPSSPREIAQLDPAPGNVVALVRVGRLSQTRSNFNDSFDDKCARGPLLLFFNEELIGDYRLIEASGVVSVRKEFINCLISYSLYFKYLDSNKARARWRTREKRSVVQTCAYFESPIN